MPIRCGRQSPDPTLRVDPGVADPVSGGTAAEATACAALNLRTYPAAAEDGDRSPRIVVDLHGVTVDVQRRADHTAVDINTEGLPAEYAPVRVNLGDTELTDPSGAVPVPTDQSEAGR